MKYKFIFIFLLLTLVCVLSTINSFAADELGLDPALEAELNALLSDESEVEVYKYPKIEPEYSFAYGYRYLSSKGSRSTDKFSYLESSPILMGSARIFPFPNRLYLDLDIRGLWDSFSELRYAYGDKIVFRWINIRLHSNFEPFPLIDTDTSTPSPGVSVDDCGDSCGTGVSINKVLLRYKTPGYAAHIFFNYHFIGRDGTGQNRYLGGSGYFNNLVRTSESEGFDSSFARYEAGANAHLGHIEAEYIFTGQYYESDRGAEVSAISGNNVWSAGTYPIGRSPKLEGNSQTFKVHSSYTGKIVLAASLSIKEFRNESSGAENDYLLGKASITWMPTTRFTLAVRYIYNDMQADNPSSVVMTDTLNPANSYAYIVKPSISYTRDKLSITGRYRPVPKVTLTGKYSVDRTDRENASIWGIENDNTTKHKASLGGKVRFGRKLSIKASVEHEKIDNPAYNSELDYLNSAILSTTWIPHQRIITDLRYTVHHGERGKLNFNDATNAKDREVLNEHISANMTFLLSKDATFTLGYYLLRNNIKQDLVYKDLSGSAFVSPGVVQKDDSTGYSMYLSYLVNERFTFATGASLNKSEASFDTNNADLLGAVPVASLNDFGYDETTLTASGSYELSSSSSIELEYKYIMLDETLDNPNNEIFDGEVQSAVLIYRKSL
jgi:hypothetical protein